MSELVRLSVADGVATVILDSQHNRNALSRALVGELSDALRAAAADSSAKAIVLRSAHRVFCSGADMSEAVEGGMETGARGLVALLRQVVTCPKPVVAVLMGPVRAGGIGIVGACDIVVASSEATFAFTEARLGLTPAVVSLTTLSRMNDRDAARTYLTGGTFDGTEAARIGLVTRAVPAHEVEAALGEVLAGLAQATPQGLRETKHLLNTRLLAEIDEHGDDLAASSARLFASEEARQAMAAFLSKRADG
ncbi:MAG: enoyl-CoA hydratase family protein [Nocardioidaceae bacterium]